MGKANATALVVASLLVLSLYPNTAMAQFCTQTVLNTQQLCDASKSPDSGYGSCFCTDGKPVTVPDRCGPFNRCSRSPG